MILMISEIINRFLKIAYKFLVIRKITANKKRKRRGVTRLLAQHSKNSFHTHSKNVLHVSAFVFWKWGTFSFSISKGVFLQVFFKISNDYFFKFLLVKVDIFGKLDAVLCPMGNDFA